MIKTTGSYILWLTFTTFVFAQTLVWLEHHGIIIPAALLILIIPVVLYFAFKEMMIKHWDYKLPVLPVIITGVLIVAISAALLTLLHGGLKYYNAPPEDREYFTLKWLFAYMIGYVKWYLIFALGAIPLAYGVLWWQTRSRK